MHPRLAAGARRVAAEVAARAVPARGGSVVWLREGERVPLPPHLYGGTAGIALFLAALAHVEPDTGEARALAVRALAPLASRLGALAAAGSAGPDLPIGGFTGVGSYLYALARVGEWTGDESLLAGARAAAALLTPARIAADRRLDVVDGCAGALLALLALERVDPAPPGDGPTPVERARWCGAHLVAARAPHARGLRAWASDGGPPLGGFAHGASGISRALLALHARTGDAAPREAALEALAWEDALFDADARGWTDPRTGRPLEQSAWCHGAPGIALARCGLPDAGPAGPLGPSFRRALRLTLALAEAPIDHLCCGNAGRAEILLHAGEAVGIAAAESLADRGALRLRPPGEPGVFDPTLMRGAAGIGYLFLRAAHRNALPCVLRLD